MPLETILDLTVILLLVPTLIYAVILNRRLSTLRRSRDELAKVVDNFGEATMRAEAGIPKLKKATTEANTALQERVEKAHTLRDDLAFMIERAEEMADRLEGAVRGARPEAPPVAPPPSRAGAAAPSFGTDPSVASRTLAGAAMAAVDDTEADLRSAIGAARAEAKVQGDQRGGQGHGRQVGGQSLEEERSEAERELLKALQSAR